MSDVVPPQSPTSQPPEQVVTTTPTTGAELFAERKDVVVARVDGELWDLDREIPAGATVEGVTIDSEDGLTVLRHSAAHVLAQAVQQVNPDAKLGIGPPVRDGFYYDFDVATPFTPEDLKALDKAMSRIIREGQTFRRRVVTEDEARAELADEPYKLELIGLKGGSSDEESVEVGGAELTIYDNVRGAGRESETVVWKDLCRGPHLPSTRLVGQGVQLMRSAAAYWRGDQKNAQLQRVYGTAWPSKDELKAYLERLAEAERRDHRKIGVEQDLFSFHSSIGSGLPLIHPRGGVIKRVMEDYVRQRHIEEGFSYVGTPHITKEDLFYTSGHLPYYGDTMFPAMEFHDDEHPDAPAQKYRLKAMNCPMHNLIYSSRGRSYRELPIRLFEFGTVYRYEKGGVVQGLTRVRGLTQDDSHSYVMPEQAADEVKHLLNFMLSVLRDFGLNDFYLELSTRDDSKPDKFVGSDEDWASATALLEKVGRESGLDLVPDPGGAAFYGPKISVQAKDALGRTWQMGTVQYDFNQPARFGLEYTAPDGTRQQPVMIHSAKFGSIERFMGVLIEHYAGSFPAWLAPVQVLAVPVAEAFDGYLKDVVAKLTARGIRAEVDLSDDRFAKKIRNASKEKVPFVLIAGGEDAEAGAVSFRYRDGRQENGVPVDEAVERIVAAVRDRVQV
ncbi:threonine--tRNA ligase [Xylanimonas protaetiae]|uniref:threonine--tRNA ligase n=1 Tax=Xylanimonas protaetiae TaxID=2509457 RepID=UPI0026C49782